MPKLTLTPEYMTAGTVRFKEEADTKVSNDWLSTETSTAILGALYLKKPQAAALGWAPTTVGPEYLTEPDRNNKQYKRQDIEGPSLTVEIKVA